jgi:hypothetical protein
MKKLVLLVILALGFFNFGCEKCEECDPDEYYIKYAVGVQANAIWVPIDIEIINEYGDKVSYSDTDSWNITVGSVEEDFTASLRVELNQNFLGDATLIANIQVSKNDGPFVLKASGESADENEPVQIDYTIDF